MGIKIQIQLFSYVEETLRRCGMHNWTIITMIHSCVHLRNNFNACLTIRGSMSHLFQTLNEYILFVNNICMFSLVFKAFIFHSCMRTSPIENLFSKKFLLTALTRSFFFFSFKTMSIQWVKTSFRIHFQFVFICLFSLMQYFSLTLSKIPFLSISIWS